MQNLVDATALTSIYTLFALGLMLTWSVANILNLAHGAVYMMGAFVSYEIATAWEVSLWLLLPVAVLVGGGIAMALNVVAFRPIHHRIADPVAAERITLITSIGAGAFVIGVVRHRLADEAHAIPARVFDIETYHPGGLFRITNLQIVIIVFAVLATMAVGLWTAKSRPGRAVRAVAYDPEVCSMFGINPDAVRSIVMFTGGALAGAAGLLLALNTNSVSAEMGQGLLVNAFAIILVGGMGSIYGAALAAALLAGAQTLVQAYWDPSLSQAVSYLLIFIILVARPQGLFGRLTSSYSRV